MRFLFVFCIILAYFVMQGRARLGKAGQSKVGQGRAWQGKAGQGRARQGKAGQGWAGQGDASQHRASHLKCICDAQMHFLYIFRVYKIHLNSFF